jgi:hypothetical protein
VTVAVTTSFRSAGSAWNAAPMSMKYVPRFFFGTTCG